VSRRAAKFVTLPWLNEAENVIYELDGGPHKMPGCTKNFAGALESGARIMGVYDAWFSARRAPRRSTAS
jgi:hypothetical protein